MWKIASNAVLDLFFPEQCGLCGLLGPAICPDCMRKFDASVPGRIRTESLAPLDEVIYAGNYFGLFERAIPLFKYNRKTTLATPLAAILAETYYAMQAEEYEAIIPVPLHWRRQWWRGFNQSEALCEKLPKDKMLDHSLLRLRYTKQQVLLSREQRMLNIEGAIAVKSNSLKRVPTSVLLVDDVMTTGSTLRDCARALHEAGVGRIGALVLASEYRSVSK